MPRLDTSRAKTRSPTSSPPPTSPHRVKLPATPAAVARPNPLDSVTTKSSSKLVSDSLSKSPPSAALANTVGSRAGTVEPASTPAADLPPPKGTPIPEVEENSEVASAPLKDEDIIDMEIFNQILEMDDDPDDRDFSASIVVEYLGQAVTTFADMDDALAAKDLEKLASLGHFLKGSSAALGIIRVQSICEKVQNWGHLRGDDEGTKLDEGDALKKIARMTVEVRKEHAIAEKWLMKFMGPALDKARVAQ